MDHRGYAETGTPRWHLHFFFFFYNSVEVCPFTDLLLITGYILFCIMLRIKLKKGTEEGVYNQPASFHIPHHLIFSKGKKYLLHISNTSNLCHWAKREKKNLFLWPIINSSMFNLWTYMNIFRPNFAIERSSHILLETHVCIQMALFTKRIFFSL